MRRSRIHATSRSPKNNFQMGVDKYHTHRVTMRLSPHKKLMYDLYLQLISKLDYPQEFQKQDDIWNGLEIDMLSAIVAQTDISNTKKFMAECSEIEKAIAELGYEI
ncbi:hypothetical protein [Okeania sp. SIO2B9]|uniref:hypothetical protein n=1 Tax=Okeania sp. SIO2B9 TaxID=2607782 RepID=UPI00142BD390|nr:hypothetical protein [Okeania sp. SIO2B9]NES92063.1 hypothetical protein [Okeania sp. SIO2B9]